MFMVQEEAESSTAGGREGVGVIKDDLLEDRCSTQRDTSCILTIRLIKRLTGQG